MATGESKKITGSLTLEDRYQTTIYDDILEIINATITLNDPAGEIFTDKGNDTVTVANSTITNNSETGAELMFSMGSGDDSLDISNTTLNVNTFMGSGNDMVTASGGQSSTVTINNQFSLGSGDDTLILKSVLKGSGNLVFGDGNDTLILDGGHLLTTGTITGLTNLTVTGNTGTLGQNLILSGSETAITYDGNLQGAGSEKAISVSDSTVTFKTADNVKTDVAFSLANVIFNHIDGGTLEISEVSNWAFYADNSTVTLHDTVLRNNNGGLTGNNSTWTLADSDVSNNTTGAKLIKGSLDLNSVSFSNNSSALDLSETNLTGKDVSFIRNNKRAVVANSLNIDIQGVDFTSNRIGNNTDTLRGGALIHTSGALTLEDGIFSKNYATATNTLSASASASNTSFVEGGAIAHQTGDGNLHNLDFSDNWNSGQNRASSDYYDTKTDIASNKAKAEALSSAITNSEILTQGGAIAYSSGNLNFQSGSFSGNHTSAYGVGSSYSSAIAKATTTANLLAGTTATALSSAHASTLVHSQARGGGILHDIGNLFLSDVEFSENKSFAESIGSSVAAASALATGTRLGEYDIRSYAQATPTATAISEGGAIAHNSGFLSLSDTSFEQNTAVGHASASASSSAVVHGFQSSYTTTIASASALARGGAVFHNNGDMELADVTFSGNKASAHASTIASISTFLYGDYENSQQHQFVEIRATANTYAAAYGGAIFHDTGTADLKNVTFDANSAVALTNSFATASGTGYGGIKFSCSANDTARSSSFNWSCLASCDLNINSHTSAYGGAIYCNNSILNLDDTTFTNNSVSAEYSYGGAIYIDNVTLHYTVTSNKKIKNTGNNAKYGGFIFLKNMSSATFQVDGSLIIGDSTGVDSIAGDSTSTIIKTGTGTWTVNSNISGFSGNWNINAGILKLDRISRWITLDNWTIGANAELHLSELDDTITMHGDKKIGTIDLGGGSDTINTSGYHLSDGLLRISTLTLSGGGKVSSKIENRMAGSGFDLILNGVTLSSIVAGGNAADKITITQSSTIEGVLNLGNGANTITASTNSEVMLSKAVTLGTGDDILSFYSVNFEDALSVGEGKNTFSATQDAHISGDFVAGNGDDILDFGSAEFNSCVGLGNGNNTLTVTGNALFSDTFSAGKDDDILSFGSVKFNSCVELGNGNNTLTVAENAAFNDTFTAGSGDDTLNFASAEFCSSVALGDGNNTITATGDAVITGAFTAGSGDDILNFGTVQFGSTADLGAGNNNLTATGKAKITGDLILGNGNDTFSLAEATFSKDVDLGDGTNKIIATTAIFNGDLTAGSGNDTINLKQNSELHGNIALGGGRNYIYVTQNLTITDGFTLDSNGETHLVVYNNASLSSNSLNVCDPGNSNMVSVTYDWSDVEGLDKVRLLVSSDATFETFEFTVELYNQSKEFTLNVSDNYFIQFQAQDEDGWSQRYFDDTEAPDQVTGFAMDGTTAVWDDTHDNWGGNGVKQYNIQVASDANFNSVIGSYTATDNSYDFSSFADGNYFIRIQAEDCTGNKGDWSNVENLLIDNNAPTKPANVTGKVSIDSITVNWSPASDSGSGLKEYKIEFSTSSTFSSISHSATLSGTSYTASDLADGTYYFRVSAVDNVNNVSAWSTVSSVIVDTTAPQAASNVKATQNSGIVTLSWDAASDAGVGVKEYIVEYSTDSSFSSIAGTRTVSGTSCSINGLADGNYCFRVQAVDKNGNAASWSNTATVIVDSVPPAKPTASADITSATNKDVTVSAVFSSDSVVKEYSMDNRNWYAYSSGVVMSNNGTVYFRGKDEAGNYSAVASYEVTNIDKVAPTKPEVFASTTAPTNKNVTVSAEFSLDSIKQQFSYDNQTWYDYESGIVLSRNGVLYFRGINAVGNISEVARYAVTNIDKIAPSAPVASADITSLTNKPVTVSATFSDDAAKQQYSFDGYTWSSYTSSIVMESNGSVYFRAVDAAGNVSEIAEYVVENIDNVAPTKPVATADITAETNDAVTITATFSRDSVVKQYSLDNKTWQTYTDGVVMESNGFVYFRSFDAAGNVSQVAVYEVNNIIAAPVTIDDDLDGNGLADVILRHTKQGFTGAWLTTGDESVIKWGNLSDIKDDVRLLGTGKLYGSENDGQDIFFADGKSVGAWKVVDGKVTGYQYVMGVNSTTNVLGLGDFNGDGATDILLRSTSGDLGYFGTDGTGWHYLKGLGKEWSVAAVGDLNGDGLDDVVLRHDAGFAGTFLTQANNTVKWANLDTLANDMSIVGTGDFNGDGVDDVLLQKSNGWVGAWLVEDGSVDGFMGICKNTNSIEQIADFNGDGIDDLRIRTANGDIGVLYVNGADDTTWKYFQSVGSEWDTSFALIS